MPRKGIVAGIAVLIIIVLLFIPMIPITESYKVTEPYERLAKYTVVSAVLKEKWDFQRGVYHSSEVTVKNIDKFGGTFTVTHKLYDIHGLFGTKVTKSYIPAGGTYTFIAEFDTELGQDVRGEYSVFPPKVIDQQVVTKHRTVYKSIIELLLYS